MKHLFLKKVSTFLTPIFFFTMIGNTAGVLASDRHSAALRQWNVQHLSQIRKTTMNQIRSLLKSHRYQGTLGKKHFLHDYLKGLVTIQKAFQALLAQTGDAELLKSFHFLLGKKSFKRLLKKIRSPQELRRKLFQLTTIKWALQNKTRIRLWLLKHDPNQALFSLYRKASSKTLSDVFLKLKKVSLTGGKIILATLATLILGPIAITTTGITMISAWTGAMLSLTLIGLPLGIAFLGSAYVFSFPSDWSVDTIKHLWKQWI